MDILRKSLAPISKSAWDEISEEAKDTIETALSARKFVDVEGPHGFNYTSVSMGELDVPKNQPKKEVQYGINKVQPLVEIRMPFELDIWELDNLARGKVGVDLDPLTNAAKKVADFEENVIYNGFKAANISGLMESSEHKVLKLKSKFENFNELISEALLSLNKESVSGPYNLVIGSELFKYINKYNNDYPLKKHIRDQIGGDIILANNLDGAVLVAQEEGNLKLSLGQDYSIGYQAHNSKKVELYISASFTFQILDPATFVVFKK